ncbi:hypothetical protein RclHR1_03590009 [Rhizophagus clarus]|uniref:Uncharacterized protein n=1 Tax=Rhizophagus clarus TaxID=94130 RepID=A0A2Z6RN50_9GLOM|nr:hypothetical protein RclHR1_03590009 [Rhizophagus clarus]
MQSIDSLRELNAKFLAEIAELGRENAKIPELREKLLKFAEVEAENAKLRQIIEENARCKTENNELKSRVGELEQYNAELENRVVMLEQGSLVAGQSQHDNSSNNNSSNFNSVAEHHEKSLEDVCSSKQDRETDDFSPRNLPTYLIQLIYDVISKVSVLDKSDTTSEILGLENQIVEGLAYELTSGFSSTSLNKVKVDISKTSEQDMVPGSTQSLLDLFNKAIKTGQKQILCWFYYSFKFKNKVSNLTADGKIKEKTARLTIYKEMKPFLPMITDVNLRKKTERG